MHLVEVECNECERNCPHIGRQLGKVVVKLSGKRCRQALKLACLCLEVKLSMP